MPSSGISLSDTAKSVYNKMKSHRRPPYIVYKFSDDLKHVVIDEDRVFYDKQLSYNDLLGKLPNKEPRFLAFDFPHVTKEGAKSSSLILVLWCPEGCNATSKFISGSTFTDLATAFDAQNKMQGDEQSDINETSVCQKHGWRVLPDELRDELSQKPIYF